MLLCSVYHKSIVIVVHGKGIGGPKDQGEQKMKKLPLLLRLGMTMMCWAIFVSSGGLGVNVPTLLVIGGSVLYLCTGQREAARK